MLVCIPSNNVKGSATWSTFFIIWFLDDSHSSWSTMEFQCSFNLHFCNAQRWWTFFKYLLKICNSFSEKHLLIPVAHFLTDSFIKGNLIFEILIFKILVLYLISHGQKKIFLFHALSLDSVCFAMQMLFDLMSSHLLCVDIITYAKYLESACLYLCL